VSANGYGKRTPVKDWRIQGRGGKGIIAMVTSDRNGPLVKLRLVRPGEQIMVVTNGGQIIRTHIDQIREAGRNTQGVRIIRVAKDERVVDVEPLAEEDELEEGEADELDASVAESEAPPEGEDADADADDDGDAGAERGDEGEEE
jgi:DNA gyrase subunit A